MQLNRFLFRAVASSAPLQFTISGPLYNLNPLVFCVNSVFLARSLFSFSSKSRLSHIGGVSEVSENDRLDGPRFYVNMLAEECQYPLSVISFVKCCRLTTREHKLGQGLANDRGCTALTWDGPACVRVQGR